MKITIIILALALAFIVVAVVWNRPRESEINSFWDVVRNPNAMPDLDQIHKDVEDSVSKVEPPPGQAFPFYIFCLP